MLNLHPCMQARQNDRKAIHNKYVFHWNISLSACLSVCRVCACVRMYLPVKYYFFPSVLVYVTFSSISLDYHMWNHLVVPSSIIISKKKSHMTTE